MHVKEVREREIRVSDDSSTFVKFSGNFLKVHDFHNKIKHIWQYLLDTLYTIEVKVKINIRKVITLTTSKYSDVINWDTKS